MISVSQIIKVTRSIYDLKRETGICLTALKRAKQIPDDITPAQRKDYRDRLGHATRLLSTYRRNNPQMFPERVRQGSLKLEVKKTLPASETSKGTPSCCGRELESLATSEIRPGRSIGTFICRQCNKVYQYDMVYPLVQTGGEKTLYTIRRSQA